MPTIPECELPTIRVEEPRRQATESESWMDVDVDDDDEMPPLVEKPPGHDAHPGPGEGEDNEDNLPEISVASYSSLPSGGYTFIADGGESSVAGAVSTTSFQMPGALSIHHTRAGPTTSSQHEFSFSINNNASHSNSNSVSPLPSPLTDVAEEFTSIITNDIASAPRGRTKHHLFSDVDDRPASGDGEVGGAGGHIPRPPNAFILFRSSFIRSQKISGKVEGNHSTLSKIIGMYWRTLPAAERGEWEAKARIAQDEHRKRYPDWRFRPGSSKNTSQRGRGRRSKGGARKGRLKTKDGGGEEDTPTELDERVVAARHDTTIIVDKGKGRECDSVSVSAKDADKGRGRDKVESDASPQKISILIPQDSLSSKKPYHLRDRSSKSSTTSSPSFGNDHAQPSKSTSLKVTALASNASTSTNYTSVVKYFPLHTPIEKTSFSLSHAAASTPAAPDAKPQFQPTREDLRIKHITRLLVEGKEGVELERELERWERGEGDPETPGPNSSDTERGGTPLPPWSPEVPTPASDRYPNTPSSASTTDTDAQTQRMVQTEVSRDRMAPQSSLALNQLQIQQPIDEERVSSGKKRSSSAPAPGTRVPFPAQSPYQPNFYGHNLSESVADVNTRESEHNSQLQDDSSSMSTWDDSYDDYFNGYEHQQQSSSPFSSSPLSLSAGGHFQQQEQSQRQWTYPPYPAVQSVVSIPDTDHGVHQSIQASPFASRNSHRHTRTRSHLHPIQSFQLAEGQVMLQPPNSSALRPSQDQMMSSPTPSLSPVTPSSAPPGYGGGTQTAPERNVNMSRRGSIALPVTPSSKTSTWRNDFGNRNHQGGGNDGNSEALTWETDEAQRGQWFRTEPTEGETPPQPRYGLAYRDETQESTYPSPGTRNMGWNMNVPQHQQHSFQPFSPSDDVSPSSGMSWEPADEGRQGMVTCIVDPYLLASRDEDEETENAASEPPPTSSYSSLSGWAGEPVVRLSPPNYYDRKDSQSVWEVDDEFSFGFGVGFGRRGG